MSTFVALDLGVHLGYSVFAGGALQACATKRLPDNGLKTLPLLARRYTVLKELLCQLQQLYPDLTEVLYEQTDWFLSPKGHETEQARRIREFRNRNDQRALGRLEGLVEAACVELGLTPLPVKVRDAKKSLTGKMNAPKALVSQTVLTLYPDLKDAGQDALDSISVAAWRLAQEDPLWATKLSDQVAVRRVKSKRSPKKEV